jgi:glycosyltransferase involved in cell wall biosynthesis
VKKICYVATIPAVVHAFLRGHIQVAAEKYQVTVVCNTMDKHLLEGINARLILLPIERKPSPWRDTLVLFDMFTLFRREQFDIVHSIMPKTGLLAMFAAYMARVPVRIHTFTGQVWATKHGLQRILLKWFDKLIANFALLILTDSPSQRDFLLHEKVLHRDKIKVIGAGSICGVDPLRFHPDLATRQRVRRELGIEQDAMVILYVGRLNRDKGILDLATAFGLIAGQYPGVELLVVGSEEKIHFSHLLASCSEVRSRLHYVSFTSQPERYMAAADIFCLPSYREGFGLTIIEAAACAVPAVASRIYGITDAVEDGVTGILFPAADVTALTQALLKLIINNGTLKQMGQAARERALEQFSSEKISHEMLMLYGQLVQRTIGRE